MAKDASGRVRRSISTWSADEGDPGSLCHRVTLQRITGESRTASGDVVPTWSDVQTVWAKVEELGGGEVQQGQQTQAQKKLRVRIRYYPGLSTKWRLGWKGRTFGIDGESNPDGVQEFMVLDCLEKATAAGPRNY